MLSDELWLEEEAGKVLYFDNFLLSLHPQPYRNMTQTPKHPDLFLEIPWSHQNKIKTDCCGQTSGSQKNLHFKSALRLTLISDSR